MKILNLYSGIGGNRKLWQGHEITSVELNPQIAEIYKSFFPDDNVIVADAHQYLLEHFREFDFIWTSPPCQTHSRARFWGWKNSDKIESKYPDMKLYQEIIFLSNFFQGKYIIENVIPYYEPLIKPSYKLRRHLFWCNFVIKPFSFKEADINKGIQADWIKLHGLDISTFKLSIRKDQIYRNCVHPETGEHILNCSLVKERTTQGTLF